MTPAEIEAQIDALENEIAEMDLPTLDIVSTLAIVADYLDIPADAILAQHRDHVLTQLVDAAIGSQSEQEGLRAALTHHAQIETLNNML